jgi:ATP-dependent RNA helicase RhlE
MSESGFGHFKFNKQILEAITEAGFSTPTEIQERIIPPLIGGQDVVGIAQTGTGKTAAYLLPIIHHLGYPKSDHPRALILVPTKELVVQVLAHAEALAKFTSLRIVGLFGGIGPKAQMSKIENGCDIIVATPGRLLEIYARKVLYLKEVKHIVLDECDRMMDMGFWPQLREVQEKMPQKKQQMLFSATFPEKVQRIADNFMLFPLRIEITPQATPAATVDQRLYYLPNVRSKIHFVVHALRHDQTITRVMIFVQTKADASIIEEALLDARIGQVRVVHSNKGQNARINAVEEFAEGKIRVLVCTDVSSRGLDIQEVSHVINFNVPTHHEDYVHRIGRTGRAFRTGTAITLCSQHEIYHIRKIERMMKYEIPVLDVPQEVEIVETLKGEYINQMKEIDRQKRIENPDFKGAFHEKKRKLTKPKKNSKTSQRSKRR